jgi:hypothetical protein
MESHLEVLKIVLATLVSFFHKPPSIPNYLRGNASNLF